MADPAVTTPEARPAQAPDDIRNLKEEMNRKFGNIEKSNQNLSATIQSVLATLQPKKQIQPIEASDAAKDDPYEDVWYDKPRVAATKVIQEAKNETLAVIQQQQQEQAKKGNVIQGLYREYPELQDYDHPLTTKAVELFEKMSEEDKMHPISYKLAVKEAAEELNIRPKAKRKVQDDSGDDAFALGGAPSGRVRAKKPGELDPRTIEFARLVGLDVEDEKTMSNLKTRSERKNWMQWE